jgi:hypothetical protein
VEDGGGEQRHRGRPAKANGEGRVSRHEAEDLAVGAPRRLERSHGLGGHALRSRDRAAGPLPCREPIEQIRWEIQLQLTRKAAQRQHVEAPWPSGPFAPGAVDASCWSGIVAGPRQVVRIAQVCLFLAQAQEARRRRCCRERLAHPPSPEPGRVGAQDLIEGEQRRAGGEGRFGRVYPSFTLPTSPARQGLLRTAQVPSPLGDLAAAARA